MPIFAPHCSNMQELQIHGREKRCSVHTTLYLQFSFQRDFGKQLCIDFIELVNKDYSYTSIKDNKHIKPSF